MVPQTVLNRPTWFYKKEEAGGGIVEDMMAHFFDLLRTWSDPSRPCRATGHCLDSSAASPTARRSRSKWRISPASASASQNGAVGNCFASWVRRKHEEVPEFQIDGEDGSLLFSFNKLRAQTQDETPLFRFDARKVQTDSVDDWQRVELELRDPFGCSWSNSSAASCASQPTGCPIGPTRSPTSG